MKEDYKNMMSDIFELLITTAEHSLLLEFQERLNREVILSETAISEGFENEN